MKITNVINWALKIIVYFIGFAGVLFIIGSPGALDQGSITILQFVGQELLGILLVGIAFVVYIIREFFKFKYVK